MLHPIELIIPVILVLLLFKNKNYLKLKKKI